MSQYRISRRYEFESAHQLPRVPDGHKCKRLHGHHYQMEVVVIGGLDAVGFTIDFWDLDSIVSPLVSAVDHRFLNDIDGLENPTAELISEWFYKKIETNVSKLGHRLDKVRIWETPDCWAEYRHGDQ